jgi:preprotein translocase subunit Sec61beta
MKLTKGEGVSGPSSSAGLVRYFDISGGGLEVTPEVILGLSVAFILAELVVWFVF